jgi:hypothetical protein
MNRKQSRWLGTGAIFATGFASVILGIGTLSGLGSSTSGDLAISSTMIRGSTLGILLATLALVGLALAHVMRRRLRHARRMPASEPGPA